MGARSLLPKGTGKRRADDRIAAIEAEKEALAAAYEQQIAALRAENVTLLNRQAAADDHFAILATDAVTASQAWRGERARRENAEKALAQAENAIRLRDRRIADLERRVDVGVKAEHVIAQTQELDAEEIRRHCVKPVPLSQAPFATVDPGRVPPTWARENDPAA